jgi:hypothetical protein
MTCVNTHSCVFAISNVLGFHAPRLTVAISTRPCTSLDSHQEAFVLTHGAQCVCACVCVMVGQAALDSQALIVVKSRAVFELLRENASLLKSHG